MLLFSLFTVIGGFGIAFLLGIKLGAALFILLIVGFLMLTKIMSEVKEAAR